MHRFDLSGKVALVTSGTGGIGRALRAASSPQYRNPRNRKESWAGRGNRPRWLVAALKRGKKLEAFAIR
jgi:DNA-binding protein H-NS